MTITCKHCNKENISGAHVRWCHLNPKRVEFRNQLIASTSSEIRTKRLIDAHANGKFDNLDYSWNISRPRSEESKEKSRQKALASPHRRLLKSVRNYIKKDGSIVKLDSSWEEALAKRLDDINIEWIRPSPIKWIDNKGRSHNYFPDFYLIEYDVFLDPKNPYAIESQKEKLEILTIQLKNLIILTSLEQCNTFIPESS